MVSEPGPIAGESLKPAELYKKLQKAFTPHQPISLPELLAGRLDLIHRVTDAINTDDLHVVIYGDRGTGKTSIARVVAYLVQEPSSTNGRRCVLISCTADDTFTTIWRKVGQEILLSQRQFGFLQQETRQIVGRLELDSAVISPSDARLFLESIQNEMVIVIDEFDRIHNQETRALMADTIKYFSDHSVRTTLVFVGVGKTLSDLLHEHLSVTRNIAQVLVNPMEMKVLAQIIQNGCKFSGLTFEMELDTEIAKLSQGYPHYTHLMGLWAGRKAIEDGRLQIMNEDLNQAIPDALRNAAGGLQEQYERAVDSGNRTAIFKEVLLACALARKDSLGRFSVVALQEPLNLITGKNYTTGAYQAHLGRFCESIRGPILERSGNPKSYRWNFLNPQLIPFVVLQGVSQKMIQPSRIPPLQRA